MNNQLAFLTGFVAVTAVLVWFYGPWQALVTAWARQGIFELRDAWFDATAFSPETRDLPEVRAVRDYCNATIGGAQFFTWPGLLTVYAWFRLNRKKLGEPRLSAQIRALPTDQLRNRARKTVECSAYYMVAQACARSIILLPFGIYLGAKVHSLARSELANSACIGAEQSNTTNTTKAHAKALISFELEIAAAASRDPSIRPFLKRGVPA